MADPLRPPLHGVRVLELAHLIAGPICGMYLADMGADVVKVESREAPDAGRSVYPRAVRNGEGVLHLTVPQVLATGFITEQTHPRAGRFKTVATAVKLEKTPGTIRTPAPALGEHTHTVLAEAGFTSAEIEALAAARII